MLRDPVPETCAFYFTEDKDIWPSYDLRKLTERDKDFIRLDVFFDELRASIAFKYPDTKYCDSFSMSAGENFYINFGVEEGFEYIELCKHDGDDLKTLMYCIGNKPHPKRGFQPMFLYEELIGDYQVIYDSKNHTDILFGYGLALRDDFKSMLVFTEN